MRSQFTVVGLLLAVVQASPVAQPLPTACASVEPAASSLRSCQSWKPFCTSFAPQSTVTTTVTSTKVTKVIIKNTSTTTVTASTTSVITGNPSTVTASQGTTTETGEPVTTTLDTSTITADTSTIYETISATCTAGTTTPVQRRAEAAAATFGTCISKVQSKYPASEVASACSCLRTTTPTSKVTTFTTITSTSTQYKGTITVTPKSTTVPLTTFTPSPTTVTSTPVVTVTPAPETFTPTTTVTTTQYSSVNPLGNVLPSPSNIIPSPGYYDDANFQLDVPFSINLYNRSSSSLIVSTNGFIGLTNDIGPDYSSSPLPATQNPATGGLPDASIAAYWSDLDIHFRSTDQDLVYLVWGDEGSRKLGIEWLTVRHGEGARSPTMHFLLTFFEDQPGNFTVDYYQLQDGGRFATGVQSRTTGQALTYAFQDNSRVHANMKLKYNGGTNEFTLEPATATCVPDN